MLYLLSGERYLRGTMALTASNMLELGTKAPSFHLPEPGHTRMWSLEDFSDAKGLVVMFICNHCPYVKHLLPMLVKVVADYREKEIAFVAINSNDLENYPQDGPENMKSLAKSMNFTFPFLFDETQEVAKAFKAACTPDFYLFDQQMECVYRGRFDDSRPESSTPVTGKDLVRAMDLLLMGETVAEADQIPSIGCNIKWKE